MARIEALEMDTRREQMNADVRGLVAKYRAIFGWDVPEVDESLADRLIFQALREALDDIQLEPAKP